MSTSTTETGHDGDDKDVGPEDQYHHFSTSGTSTSYSRSSSSISEIEEEEAPNDDVPAEIKELFEMKRFAPLPSIKEEHDKGSVYSSTEAHSVYVAVGKSPSSEDALDWTLRHLVNPGSTMVYLIHIYPEIRQIPTPLGKLLLSQVSPEQVESYMAQERGKRRELLQKFLHKCLAAQVKVDTILIESDGLPKAILDLIDILNIRKLVVGTAKSSLRKLRSRKGTGTVDQILKSAPETCEVKIICEGNEVVMTDQTVESPSPRDNVDSSKEFDNSKSVQDEEVKGDQPISCMCFRSKFA